MLILTGQRVMDDYSKQELEVAWISGEILADPRTRTLEGKKSGKQFTITSLFVKYDGDQNADYTVTVECWGAAGRDAKKAHKKDGVICCGLVYTHEYNGKFELRAKVGIGKMQYEPVAIINRGGITEQSPKEDVNATLFTDINPENLPF